MKRPSVLEAEGLGRLEGFDRFRKIKPMFRAMVLGSSFHESEFKIKRSPDLPRQGPRDLVP